MAIKSFKHKGLKKLFTKNDTSGVKQSLVMKIQVRLTVLDAATCLEDLSNPAWRLHEHKGQSKGVYSLDVSGNERILFEFDGDAHKVDLDDPH